jgi:NTP pyrophosphatase (non-canonical NTP hydrolase)
MMICISDVLNSAVLQILKQKNVMHIKKGGTDLKNLIVKVGSEIYPHTIKLQVEDRYVKNLISGLYGSTFLETIRYIMIMMDVGPYYIISVSEEIPIEQKLSKEEISTISGIVKIDDISDVTGLAMTFDQYQELTARTVNPESDCIECYALGLTGEAGETADEIKKVVFHGHDLDKEKVKKELGDVLWYASRLAAKIGISFNDVAESNIKKLQKRYPNGFEKNKSIERVEK